MASIIRSRKTRAWFIPIPAHLSEETGTPRRRVWVALALLAGYLLSCHGCHGDEDNELFVATRIHATIKTIAAP